MQISQNISNSYHPTTFTARNSEIKALDDICRSVCREFPVVSNTKLDMSKSILHHPQGYNIFSYVSDLISEMRGFLRGIPNKKKRIISELEALKALKVGNCNELANSAYIACQINGYKNAVPMHLYAYNTKSKTLRSLDHTVIGINFKKEMNGKPENIPERVFSKDNKAVVLDPWLGFTDYANEATAKYKNHSFIGENLKQDEKICYLEGTAPEITSKDILFFKHKYLNLARNKHFSLIDRIKWKFMKKNEYNTPQFPITIKESHKKNNKLRGALSKENIIKMYEAEHENRLDEFWQTIGRK